MIDNGIMALILLVANPGWIQGLFHFYRTFATLPEDHAPIYEDGE